MPTKTTKPRSVSIATVRGHIEQSSYLQTLAGLIAVRIVQGISVDEYEQDWNASDYLMAALLTALRQELIPQVQRATLAYAKTLGYSGNVDAIDVSQIIEEEFAAAQATATPALKASVDSLRQRLRLMADAGLSAQALGSILDSDAVTRALTQKIEGVAKSAASSLVKAIEASTLLFAQAAASAEAAATGETILWDWITMQDGNECESMFADSCGPRHGRAMTMEDWIGNGLPQGPHLLCSIYSRSGVSQCRCFLIQHGTMQGSQFGPFDMSAAVKSGRSRAQSHPRFGRKTA